MPRLIAVAAFLLLLGAGCPSVPLPGSEPPTGRLDLSGRGLTALPASALDDAGLGELDISDNRIGGALPSEIGRLQALRVLDASGNRMTGVPAEIGSLGELRLLDLSDNALTGLPLELANLKKLESLDLRGNAVAPSDLEAIRAGIPQATILID